MQNIERAVGPIPVVLTCFESSRKPEPEPSCNASEPQISIFPGVGRQSVKNKVLRGCYPPVCHVLHAHTAPHVTQWSAACECFFLWGQTHSATFPRFDVVLARCSRPGRTTSSCGRWPTSSASRWCRGRYVPSTRAACSWSGSAT